MKYGTRCLILMALLCLLACAAVCARAEDTLPLSLSDGEKTPEEFWIGDSIRIDIDASDAKELYLYTGTGEEGGMTALHTGVFEDQWNRLDEYGWGEHHENVFYWTRLKKACDYVIYAEAVYWEGGEKPADESAVTRKKSEKLVLHVQSNGPVGEAVLEGSVPETIERGGMMEITVHPGEHAEFVRAMVCAGENGDGSSLAEYSGDSEGFLFIPTWKLPAGRYSIRFICSGAHYEENSSLCIPFTVTEQEPWQEPDRPVWKLSRETANPGEPVTVAVYVPGADSVTVQVSLDGQYAGIWGMMGDTTVFTTAFEQAGTADFLIFLDDMSCPEGYSCTMQIGE